MEQPSDKTLYLFRPQFGNEADIARLNMQHQVYSEVAQLFSPHFQPQGDETLLDIGCGPGGWVIDTAFKYPHTQIVGLDIDESAIRYATTRAKTQHTENVSFEVHDVTTGLPFQDESVDYVNISLANSFLLRDHWSRLLVECQRVLRPGGWLRSTEWLVTQTSSLAIFKTTQLFNKAIAQDGRRYVELAPFLEVLLKQAGFVTTPLNIHKIDFSENAPAHHVTAEMYYVAACLSLPFMLRYNDNITEEEAKELVEATQRDMMLPNFYGFCFLADLAAQKPI